MNRIAETIVPTSAHALDSLSGLEHPRVAVVMTVYNGMPYLPAAVDSILGQTMRQFEFFIVDDGSTDKTIDFLRSLRDPRVTIIQQSRAGQQAAAHRAIVMAKADYIARMDSDDISSPERLEKQAKFLDEHQHVGLVGTQITRRGDRGSGMLSHFPTQHEEIVDDLLHNRHSMCNPATMFRRQLYLDLGGYWEHNIAEDWDLFLRLADRSQLANLNEPLLSYRFHTGSINGRRIVEAQLYNEYAADRSKRRTAGLSAISYEEFFKAHRINRFPSGLMFRVDCHSVAQYRKGIAEWHSGKRTLGGIRTLYSTMCSPKRLFRRAKSFVISKLS
jgi:glycosyltransferase involved in cell wall biosynthesis